MGSGGRTLRSGNKEEVTCRGEEGETEGQKTELQEDEEKGLVVSLVLCILHGFFVLFLS